MYAKDLFNYVEFVGNTLHALARAREQFLQYDRKNPTHLSINITNHDGKPIIEIDIDKEFDANMTNWLSDETDVRQIFFGYTEEVKSFIHDLFNDFEASWIKEGDVDNNSLCDCCKMNLHPNSAYIVEDKNNNPILLCRNCHQFLSDHELIKILPVEGNNVLEQLKED
jgi:hypothetical protein